MLFPLVSKRYTFWILVYLYQLQRKDLCVLFPKESITEIFAEKRVDNKCVDNKRVDNKFVDNKCVDNKCRKLAS